MMRTKQRQLPWLPALAVLALPLLLAPGSAGAFPQTLLDWQDRYRAGSLSGDTAQCQLCHADPSGGNPWNAYGWDILLALENVGECDANQDGSVSNAEALYCTDETDSDGNGPNNAWEIGEGAQPGWAAGANNTIYTRVGSTSGQLPPDDIEPLDPEGTEPPPHLPGSPVDPAPHEPLRMIQYVWPGESIQRAIDRAMEGGTVYVFPGEYVEFADDTNGLNISRSVNLIGLSSEENRVVLLNAGNQRNGIVVVPEDRLDCMGCHSSLAPPFDLLPGIEGSLEMREPMIEDLLIRGITIKDFNNNGLFTENVDGFEIIDVESIDNPNYGIFPTLSRNGLIAESLAVGADDSGIWVETSENVTVTRNIAERNTNGFEISNSDDIELTYNVARNNTVGFASLLLPDIFDDRAGAKRIHIRNNTIYENNKPNTARPGSVLATVPAGTGILHLGVDESDITDNWIADNKFTGIAIVDYCVTVLDTPFSCTVDPNVTPEYLADESARDNHVEGNVMVNNGTEPDPGPFDAFAADIILLTIGDRGNCFSDNEYDTQFASLPELPECVTVPEPGSAAGICASLLTMLAVRRRSRLQG